MKKIKNDQGGLSPLISTLLPKKKLDIRALKKFALKLHSDSILRACLLAEPDYLLPHELAFKAPVYVRILEEETHKRE